MLFLREEVRDEFDAEEWVSSPSDPPMGRLLADLVGGEAAEEVGRT